MKSGGIFKTNTELCIAHSWFPAGEHGISGHVFEVIDYYLHLSQYFDCCILFGNNFTPDLLRACIVNKYDLTDEELEILMSKTHFHHKPKMIICNKLLLTDGFLVAQASGRIELAKIMAKKIFTFVCEDVVMNQRDDVVVLQDKRVYPDNSKNLIDYKKRLNLQRLKKAVNPEDHTLVYGTVNCREVSDEDVLKIHEKYGDVLYVTDKKVTFDVPGIEVMTPPVDDIIEKFTRFIYTPLQRKFDCSSRFLAECAYLGKDIEFYNIDYWDEDKGLYWRWWDIENDFESLSLENDTQIVEIINENL